jgi:iron complex outermembrane recepter protein
MSYRRAVLESLRIMCWLGAALPYLGHAEDAGPIAASTTGIEEITVTARRKAENIQSVPVTIATANTETLQDRGGNIAQLTQLVPGLQQNAYSDRNNISFAIRGQQQSYGTLYPAVVTYFADMPLSRVSDGQTFDIDNVQVLKGPQGTLFGRLTDGGAILLNPKKPTNDFDGYVEAKFGNYDQQELLGAVNIPIVSDKLTARFAFDTNRREGYTENLFDGKRLDNVSYEAARLGIRWNIIDGLENYSVVNYNHSDTNGTATVLLQVNPTALTSAGNASFIPAFLDALARQSAYGPRTVNIGYAGPLADGDGVFYKRQVLWAVNTTTWQASDQFSLKGIFGYVYNKELENDDFDGTNINYTQSLSRIPMTVGQDMYYEQFTGELQAQGKLFRDRLSYTMGVYSDYKRPPGPTELYGLLYDSVQYATATAAQLRSKAVYGQITYDLSDFVEGLKVDLGARETHDHLSEQGYTYYAYDVAPTSLPQNGQCLTSLAAYPNAVFGTPCETDTQDSSIFTYTLGVDYQISPNVFTYFSLRRGARQGGVNIGAASYDPQNPTFKPEFDLSHELGIKADWSVGDVALRTNFAMFYDNYSDIQTYLYVTSPNGALFTTVHNAAQATIKGIEADLEVVPLPGLTISGNWAYTEAAYSTANYTAAQIAAACPANSLLFTPDLSLVCPRNPLPNVPRNTVRTAIQYELPLSGSPGRITLGGDMYYTSSRFTGGDVDVASGTIPAYTLFNLNASWNNAFDTPVDVSFFVNNVADKVYLESKDDEISNGDTGITKGFYGPPRMYGVTLRYRFGKSR